jgi:HAD superfamily hydrolase (TIGR01490 family)
LDLALFDFDGTITITETYPLFMRRAVPRSRLVLGAIVLAPWLVGYKLGRVSGQRVRASMVRIGLKGVGESQIGMAGAAFARDVLPHVTRPVAMERIQWHQDRGDRVVIVSAALDVYLRPWARPLGIDVVCSRLESANGVLTGRYVGADCCGPEKARRVREQYDLTTFNAVYAYGDTDEDHELLQLASHRVYRWTAQVEPSGG